MKREDMLELLDGVLARLGASDVRTLSLQAEGVSLHIERGQPAAPAAAPPSSAENAPARPAADAPSDEEEPAANVVLVKSPVVGTFYAAPAPDEPPFVAVGSRVSKGDTLCILEAMKMMNEIEAERDGVVRRVLLKNGDLAEYGQTLFEMEAE